MCRARPLAGAVPARMPFLLLLVLAVLVAVAAWLGRILHPATLLERRTLHLARNLLLDQSPRPPYRIIARLSDTEDDLVPDAIATFAWPGGDTWTIEGRRELKDLHASLLAEAPRLGLALDGLSASAKLTARDTAETAARATLRLTGETTLDAPVRATLRWRKTSDGWKIVRAEFVLEESPTP